VAPHRASFAGNGASEFRYSDWRLLQTYQTRADPALQTYADLLEAFNAFGAPLALLDANGCTERVNARFLRRFSSEGVNTGRLRDLIRDSRGGWQRVSLSPHGGDDHKTGALAVRTANHILLVVEEASAGGRHDLDALRARIVELEQVAATDQATGAWNRPHLDLIIESELAQSVASRHPLSLLLFDIDNFRNIVDDLGHAVASSVLRELVHLAHGRVRASDMLFRRDAEKILVLLSSAGYRGAERVAENLRQAVSSHAFSGAGAVTISVGVVEHDGNEDAPMLFRRLDEALSEAKRQGRNCIVVSRRGNSDAWAAEAGASALYLTWHERYECGEPTVDRQHRELYQLANLMNDATLPDNQGSGAMHAAINELMAHTVRHYADEEAVLERLNYAQLPEHRQAHARLVRRARYMAQLEIEGKVSPGAIVAFLTQDVVARHLMIVDRAFFPMFGSADPRTLAPPNPISS